MAIAMRWKASGAPDHLRGLQQKASGSGSGSGRSGAYGDGGVFLSHSRTGRRVVVRSAICQPRLCHLTSLCLAYILVTTCNLCIIGHPSGTNRHNSMKEQTNRKRYVRNLEEIFFFFFGYLFFEFYFNLLKAENFRLFIFVRVLF